MSTIDQVFPEKKQVPLKKLYLDQRLRDKAAGLGRSLVFTDYVTDRNDVVAKADRDGHFQVPAEIKNSSDWERFQELMAQADVIISGGSYFKGLAAKGGKAAQDILYQFEPGGAFETLGEWRLSTGHPKRSPDVAIISRHLDFEIPGELLKAGRRIMFFTTDSQALSEEARKLQDAGATVIGSGGTGVDGDRMIAALAEEPGYRVIMMASGPHVLDLLLKADRLDYLYVTQVQLEIPFTDPAKIQTILPEGRKISELKEFRLAHHFVQGNVVTESGSLTSQSFLRYDRQDVAAPG